MVEKNFLKFIFFIIKILNICNILIQLIIKYSKHKIFDYNHNILLKESFKSFHLLSHFFLLLF